MRSPQWTASSVGAGGFAASIMGIIPVVILFAFSEKHLVGGLTAGSIK